jgi:hypothetical protein
MTSNMQKRKSKSGPVTINYSSRDDRGMPVKETVRSFDALAARLDSLAQELFVPKTDEYKPNHGGVHLHNAAGDVMGVGLADEGWVLMYAKAKRMRTDWSLGNPRAKGSLEYCFQQWESLPRKYLIPREKALKVLGYWFETGRLSRSIKWLIEEY